jgi:hypothetical protein
VQGLWLDAPGLALVLLVATGLDWCWLGLAYVLKIFKLKLDLTYTYLNIIAVYVARWTKVDPTCIHFEFF